jgi:hypothetical protein
MVKFSFVERESYIPVAKIESDDKMNGEILWLDPSVNTNDNDDNEFNYEKQSVNYSKYMKNTNAREASKKSTTLGKYLAKNKEPEDSELLSIYKSIKKDGSKDITLKNGTFLPIPDIHRERVSYYVFGSAGSGKSYFCASVLRQWIKLNHKGQIFLFSQMFEDPVLDKLPNLKRIDVSTLEEEPIDIYDLPENCFCVFDDVDSITNKNILKAVADLESSIHQIGRKLRINIIKTSHLGSNGLSTKLVLSESQYITCYPSSGSFAQISYVLKQYVGLSNKDLEKIKSLRSRWVMVSKTYPQYVLSETSAYLLSA